MKILGISFGTLHGNSETLTKAALMGAEEAGAQVELIRYMDFKIKPSRGNFENTKADDLEDDFALLEEHIYQADGLILASPMYSWGPTDGYRILCDRINDSHNVALLRRRGLLGNDAQCDQRVFKTRVAGMITVGGTKEETKTVTTIPLMHVLTYGMQIHVLDHVICKDTGAPGGVLAYPEKVAHAHEMGKRVALACGTPAKKMTWQGEAKGICPYCHNDLVTFRLDTNTFRCAVCGVEGRLTWENGSLSAHVDESEDNLPIQSDIEMNRFLDELEERKKDWEKKKDFLKLKMNGYENYPVPAFRLHG